MNILLFLAILLFPLTGQAQNEDVPCLDNVSYDCVAEFVYNSLPERDDYSSFNNGLRTVLSHFCDVKDKALLQKVLARMERFEATGALEEYDDRRISKSPHFPPPSIKTRKACLLRALGKDQEAWKIWQKHSRKPLLKHEIAHQKIINGDLDGAFQLIKSITADDIQSYRTSIVDAKTFHKTCFDCRSAENKVLVNLLKEALYAQRYELAQEIIEVFPRFEISDEDASQAMAQRMYDQLKAENGKVDRTVFCEMAVEKQNYKNMIVCARVHQNQRKPRTRK